jgi:transposase, IS5 family
MPRLLGCDVRLGAHQNDAPEAAGDTTCSQYKRALIVHQRYADAKQFKRANRALRTIRTYLGRVCRDLVRKTSDDAELHVVFAQPLSLAFAVREQRQHQRGRKVYSLHAPEVECIGKGKTHRPYEFGVKVPLATTLHRSKCGLFIAHVKALPGNPYDGHTLKTFLPEIEAQIGAPLTRVVAAPGYRGHNAPPDMRFMRFKVHISGQKRGVTDAIKRELRRRSAVEPVIGQAKAEHRMGHNFLKGSHDDAANAVLAPPRAATSAFRATSVRRRRRRLGRAPLKSPRRRPAIPHGSCREQSPNGRTSMVTPRRS